MPRRHGRLPTWRWTYSVLGVLQYGWPGRETPAYDAGFNVEDEVVAVDDFRVGAGEWNTRLRQYAPGDEVSVLVSRRGMLRRIAATLGEAPDDAWQLEVDPNAHFIQEERVEAWLGIP
jgi:predicted metalloprotease with PDZ domain|tara:strand:+ start:141 stop:494 length:354 start_codon:yes stop_codon:yes gene_type:complete